jgi:hypothetical protein
MGFLDALLGRKPQPRQPASAESGAASGADELSRIVGDALGEALSPSSQQGKACFMSASQVVAVCPEELLTISTLVETKPENLQTFEGKTGVEGGTAVKAELYSKITAALDAKKMPYRVFISRSVETPMVLRTGSGNIYIAPLIEV